MVATSCPCAPRAAAEFSAPHSIQASCAHSLARSLARSQPRGSWHAGPRGPPSLASLASSPNSSPRHTPPPPLPASPEFGFVDLATTLRRRLTVSFLVSTRAEPWPRAALLDAITLRVSQGNARARLSLSRRASVLGTQRLSAALQDPRRHCSATTRDTSLVALAVSLGQSQFGPPPRRSWLTPWAGSRQACVQISDVFTAAPNGTTLSRACHQSMDRRAKRGDGGEVTIRMQGSWWYRTRRNISSIFVAAAGASQWGSASSRPARSWG